MGPLILIADRSLGERVLPALSEVFSCLDGRTITVLDRWHGDLQGERWRRLRALKERCQAHDATLLVSGRADMALAVKAQGVHLPEQGLPAALLQRLGLRTGRSCHQRHHLEHLDADYAFLSPVAPPHSKQSPLPALGVQGFIEAIQDIPKPVYALGGITPELGYDLALGGAAGVATIGYILGSISPRASALSLADAWAAGLDARHGSAKGSLALVDKG